jgi:hypothetical protein
MKRIQIILSMIVLFLAFSSMLMAADAAGDYRSVVTSGNWG